MDTSTHTLETLFSQLGLSNHPESMLAFFSSHRLSTQTPLEHAAFWSSSQAQFIHEAIEQDSDWAEVVDQLDAQLRH